MNIKYVTGLFIAVAMAIGMPLAQAAGNCPTGNDWSLVPASLVLPEIDKGNFKDQNKDGWLCFRIPLGFCNNRGINGPECGAWVWKDNTN